MNAAQLSYHSNCTMLRILLLSTLSGLLVKATPLRNRDDVAFRFKHKMLTLEDQLHELRADLPTSSSYRKDNIKAHYYSPLKKSSPVYQPDDLIEALELEKLRTALESEDFPDDDELVEQLQRARDGYSPGGKELGGKPSKNRGQPEIPDLLITLEDTSRKSTTVATAAPVVDAPPRFREGENKDRKNQGEEDSLQDELTAAADQPERKKELDKKVDDGEKSNGNDEDDDDDKDILQLLTKIAESPEEWEKMHQILQKLDYEEATTHHSSSSRGKPAGNKNDVDRTKGKTKAKSHPNGPKKPVYEIHSMNDRFSDASKLEKYQKEHRWPHFPFEVTTEKSYAAVTNKHAPHFAYHRVTAIPVHQNKNGHRIDQKSNQGPKSRSAYIAVSIITPSPRNRTAAQQREEQQHKLHHQLPDEMHKYTHMKNASHLPEKVFLARDASYSSHQQVPIMNVQQFREEREATAKSKKMRFM